MLDYNLVAQDLSGVREYPVTAQYATATVPKIEAALGLTALRPGGPDTTNERGKQFRSIVINRTGGTRPGAVPSFALWKRPSAVARPDFGCRFSDPAAYAAGTGTRRLFPACP